MVFNGYCSFKKNKKERKKLTCYGHNGCVPTLTDFVLRLGLLHLSLRLNFFFALVFVWVRFDSSDNRVEFSFARNFGPENELG